MALYRPKARACSAASSPPSLHRHITPVHRARAPQGCAAVASGQRPAMRVRPPGRRHARFAASSCAAPHAWSASRSVACSAPTSVRITPADAGWSAASASSGLAAPLALALTCHALPAAGCSALIVVSVWPSVWALRVAAGLRLRPWPRFCAPVWPLLARRRAPLLPVGSLRVIVFSPRPTVDRDRAGCSSPRHGRAAPPPRCRPHTPPVD